MTWEDKEPKVLKSVDRLHLKLPFRFMVPNYLTLYLYRSLAAVEGLALQESHFNNFHNLAPYFELLCFSRLESVYIVPLELKNDIDFFCSCTVSYVSDLVVLS